MRHVYEKNIGNSLDVSVLLISLEQLRRRMWLNGRIGRYSASVDLCGRRMGYR